VTLSAIILAAGASRRLGQPKQLVHVDGETLLGRTVRIALESGAGPVVVVLGANRDRIVAEVDLSGCTVVENPLWEQGIASSIRAGLKAVEQLVPEAAAVMLLVCDQPRLTADHLRRLREAFEAATQPAIAASAYAGIAGIPAIFPEEQFRRLLALEGDTGARRLLKESEIPLIVVPFEGGAMDVDTPEDLADIKNP